MKTAIVGTKFCGEAAVAALVKLQKGAPLRVVREPDNAHDLNAIAVYSVENEHLGYLPRTANTELARDIDAGREFFAVLTDEAIISGNDIRFAAKIAITPRVPR
jgi:hypothetical protein